jgi:hypothetical protein
VSGRIAAAGGRAAGDDRAVAAAAISTVAFAGLTCLAWFAQFSWRITDRWFWPTLALTVCYLLGATLLWHRGLRRVDEQTTTAAAGWPRCKLAAWLGGSLATALATAWIIDMQIQQRLLALQAEARSLALSVAAPMIPDAENAAVIYREASEAMDNLHSEHWEEPSWRKWMDYSDDPSKAHWDTDDPDLDRFLRLQASTLTLLREAASLIDCDFDFPHHRPSYDARLPGNVSMHSAARLTALDARWNAAHGNMDVAIADVRTLFAMVEHLSDVPMYAARVDHWAITTLCTVLASGRVSYEDLATIRLEEGLSYNRLVERILRRQEACGLGSFCEYALGDPCGWFYFMGTNPLAETLGRYPQLYRFCLLEEDLAAYRRFCRNESASSYYRHHEPDDLGDRPDRSRAGWLTHLFSRWTSDSMRYCVVADARRRVARAALAAAKFQAEERDPPESLDELVPDFLLAVPFDPFDGKPLRMKRTARGIVIYSIGPDATDDGGEPLDEAERTGDITFELPDRKQPAI